jgi:hypothetical protein
MSFQKPRPLSERELNTIRGKAIVGHASTDEILSVFRHLDTIEQKLDEAEEELGDFFGTEGWRHWMGYPDAD